MNPKYSLIITGGSIGENRSHLYKGQRASVIATDDHRDEQALQVKAKRMNVGLSKGEKSYYKIKFRVVHSKDLISDPIDL